MMTIGTLKKLMEGISDDYVIMGELYFENDEFENYHIDNKGIAVDDEKKTIYLTLKF